MLKIKMGQLTPTLAALESIGAMKVPMNVARKMAANMKAVREVIEMSDKTRKEILAKYGDTSKENPDSFKVREDCMTEFNAEWKVFMEEEIEFPEIRKIQTKELPNGYTIEPTKLELLDWMFIEESTQKVVPIDKAKQPEPLPDTGLEDDGLTPKDAEAPAT